MQLGPGSEGYQARSEVQWIIQENCQCTLSYDFSVQDGYFTCTANDYVIFRAKLSASFESPNAVHLASLKANLSSLLANEDKIQILWMEAPTSLNQVHVD